ncbi:alpha-(1,3)-fucosyltransferase C-like [Haemaphysalis longicornis]
MAESGTRRRSSTEERLQRSPQRAAQERLRLNPQQYQALEGQRPAVMAFGERSDNSDFWPFPPAHCCHSCSRRIAFAISVAVVIFVIAAAGFYSLGRYQGRTEKPSGTAPVAPTLPWLPWRDRTDDVGVPRILVWNRPSSFETSARTEWLGKTPRACSSGSTHSPRRECEVTGDRKLLPKSDAIVFHADRLSRADLPSWHASLQMWVFWVHTHLPYADSSAATKHSLSLPDLARRFNWTMGHREDADVKIPYKTWTCQNTTSVMDLERVPASRQAIHKMAAGGQDTDTQESSRTASNLLETKKDAAWILADCELNRFDQARNSPPPPAGDLAASNVDTPVRLRLFPACGAAHCKSPAGCIGQIAQDYHFIIVSITPECFSSAEELIYDAFEHDVVPVVLAPHDAVLNLPPNSVVTSSDLQGHGQLSGYLRSLLDDPAKYESYFAWKQNCTVTTPMDDLCPLCESLWEQPMPKGAHPDVLQWWTLRSQCQDEPLFGLDSTFEAYI